MTKEEIFEEKARAKHGNTYIYEHVIYVNARTKVTIYCKRHGPFLQTPNNHLSGQGCPSCAELRKLSRIRNMALTTEEFISRGATIHRGKYNYDHTIYTSGTTPVVIHCREHGPFVVKRAEKHLSGQGCPKCSQIYSLAEEMIKEWLISNTIPFYFQHHFNSCVSPTGRKMPFDFFLPNHNLVIEYDGEHHYKPSPLFHPGDKFHKQQIRDDIKTSFLKAHKIELLRIPYTEFNNLTQILEDKIG